jgi:CRP-like cAMP-binding protein
MGRSVPDSAQGIAGQKGRVVNLGLETGTAAPALVAALRPQAAAARLWAERTLGKGDAAFAPGDNSGDVYLLLQGLVRLVYTTENGEAWIKSFIIDCGVFSGRGAADRGNDSYGAECVEPCRFVRLPRAFVAEAVARDAGVRAAYDAFQAWVLSRKQAREAALLTLTPEARLRAVLSAAPDIAARLPQGDIARFIGVTPVAFSRIKRRIAQTGSISPSDRRA